MGQASLYAGSTGKESCKQAELRGGFMKNSGPASALGASQCIYELISELQFPWGERLAFLGII